MCSSGFAFSLEQQAKLMAHSIVKRVTACESICNLAFFLEIDMELMKNARCYVELIKNVIWSIQLSFKFISK